MCGITFAKMDGMTSTHTYESKSYKETIMKKTIVILSICAILFAILGPTASYARGPCGHRGGCGWGIAGAVVGGLALGAIVANALTPPPPPPVTYYYAPPPPRPYYYYAPPPPRPYYGYPVY